MKLATVTSVSDSGIAKVTFYGEETESTKEYKALNGISLAINDVVVMDALGDSYIILGKLDTQCSSGGGGETDYLTQSEADNLYAASSHSHNMLTAEESTHYTVRIGRTTFCADSSNVTLGYSSKKWGAVYSTTGTIQTSDINEKNSITDIPGKYKTFFKKLMPKVFKFNDNTSDRLHTGFIAQEVEQAMTESNITSQEFAGFIKSPKQDEEGNVIDGYNYGLRYADFIPLNTMMIQDLMSRVESLEKKGSN